MTSSFSALFRVSTFGESHGGGVGVVIDGVPPRLPITVEELQTDLDRRRPGQSRLVTQRDEADRAEILSGVFEGYTTGTPLAVLVRNEDHNSGAYDHLKDVYRPSHADFTYDAKYGIRNWAGGGRASARETIGRVAAAAVARKLLATVAGIEVLAWVQSVGEIEAEVDAEGLTLDAVEADPTRCPDPVAAAAMTAAIEQARRDGDRQRQPAQALTAVAEGIHRPDEGNDEARRSRAGQADEPAFIGRTHLGIEAGKAQRRTGRVQEGRRPAHLGQHRAVGLEADQGPVVHHQGRRHAEAHQVGQGVVLDPEFAGGARQAGHPTVDAVEQASHENRDAGVFEVAAGRGQDGVEAGKQPAGGQQVGQQVDASAARGAGFFVQVHDRQCSG